MEEFSVHEDLERALDEWRRDRASKSGAAQRIIRVNDQETIVIKKPRSLRRS